MRTTVTTTNTTALPPTPPSTLLSQQPYLWTNLTNPILSPLSPRNPILSIPHILRPITFTQCRRREEESEFRFDDGIGDAFYRKRRRDGRRWWSDDSPEEVEESGIIEEVIDSIWILKVFGSYGWLLPFFIISLLAATGPKAFLLSLAVPVAQSVLTLAFNKLFSKSKRKTRTRRKKRRPRTPSKSVPQEEAAEESQPPRMGEMGYKSWVPSDDDSPVSEEGQDSSSFGGWEELVEPQVENDTRSSRRSDQTSQPRRGAEAETGKFRRRERKAEMPLLLRLLVAVFPFLGSWTKML